MKGEWVKKPRWKMSHFLRADKRTVWMKRETGMAACGSMSTGIDITDRCGRRERVLTRDGDPVGLRGLTNVRGDQ